jgi:glycosyltransferase involved in cell wall biosynthesis
MRVAFDVTALLAGNTGVARYVRELGAALEAQGVELAPFAIGRGDAAALPAATRRVRVPLRVVHRSWSLLRAPSGERLAPACDVVHTPDLVPPPTRRPLVLTVHDLVTLEYPDLHPPRAQAVQRAQLDAARSRADVVCAVSQATADALCARGVDPDRVVVTPNGVRPLPPPDESLVPGTPFLLAVGTLTPRKGFETLVAAFARARATLGDDVRLVLAGPMSFDGSTVGDAVHRHGLADRVVSTGRVTDAQLAALYEHCRAVCVPSIAEGFGLPVLEAAAAGAPVVASDLAVFRELDGAVARYAAPGDVEGWADALVAVVADAALRQATGARARAFAAQYTWPRTARCTVAAYERAQQVARRR